MATLVGSHGDANAVLQQLIKFDYDAVEAYMAAIDRLTDPEPKLALTAFQHDHERHVQELGAHLRAIGGEPPHGPDAKRVLTEGKVIIAGLMGDRAILAAMKTNESDTNRAYERATSRNDLAADLQTLLLRNLDDERRHKAWIEQRLAQMKSEHAHP